MSLKPIQPNANQTPERNINPINQLIGDLTSSIAKPAIRNLTDTFGQFMPEAYRPDTREAGASSPTKNSVNYQLEPINLLA